MVPAPATSSWLPPGGGEAAERSEADEGWRQAGSRMQLDEWQMFRVLPFIREI